MNYSRKHNKNTSLRYNRLLVILFAVFVVFLLLLISEVKGFTHFFNKKKAISGIIPSNQISEPKNTLKSSPEKTASPDSSLSDTSKAASDQNLQNKTVRSDLQQPSGAFVSNHRANLSSKEQSVCNTTPGAECRIELRKDGITKTLQAKTADDRGAVYWDWSIDGAGLVDGKWDIEAIATLGDQTKATKDSLQLVVVP